MTWLNYPLRILTVHQKQAKSDVEQEFKQITEQIFSTGLKYGCLIGILSYVVSFFIPNNHAYPFMLLVLNSVVFVLVMLTVIFGSRRVHLYVHLTVLYIFGAFNFFYLLGANELQYSDPSSHLLFMLCIILTGMTLGYKVALVALATISVTYMSLVPLTRMGFITSFIDRYDHELLLSWLLGFIPVALLGMLMTRLIVRRMKNLLQEQAVLTAELQQKTDDLTVALNDLQRALAQEQEVNRIHTELVTTVSHEFRTPLTIINTSARFLERHYDKMEQEKRTKYYENIRSGVVRLVELTDRIVNINAFTEKNDIQQVIGQLSA